VSSSQRAIVTQRVREILTDMAQTWLQLAEEQGAMP
jgi:hypothetical protein